MLAMKLAFIAAVAVLLLGSSSALTVTLTGTCRGIYVSNSTEYVEFLLNNSGNGPATNLSFVPTSQGISLSAQQSALPVLYPGNSSATRLDVTNATYNGTYAFGMYVSYLQGGQTFVVTFPCLVSRGKPSAQFAYISNMSISNGRLSTEITSIYGKGLPVTLYFIVPPTFTISPKSTTVYMNGSSVEDVNSSVDEGKAFNGQVTLTGVVSYVIANRSYASIYTLPVSLSQSGGAGIDMTWVVLGAAVALIAALIVASVVLKRRKPGPDGNGAAA